MSHNNAFDEVNSFRLTRNDDGQIELSDSFTQDAALRTSSFHLAYRFLKLVFCSMHPARFDCWLR